MLRFDDHASIGEEYKEQQHIGGKRERRVEPTQ